MIDAQKPETVAVAMGSNLGGRVSHIEFAAQQLGALLGSGRVSSLFETEPMDVGEDQPMYLNAVFVGETTLDPRALLARLLAIERDRGRVRPRQRAARTLDLDLVLFGSVRLDQPGLTIPHPRFRERRFVLEPLAEVSPFLVDPVTGRTVRELLDALQCAPSVTAGRAWPVRRLDVDFLR